MRILSNCGRAHFHLLLPHWQDSACHDDSCRQRCFFLCGRYAKIPCFQSADRAVCTPLVTSGCQRGFNAAHGCKVCPPGACLNFTASPYPPFSDIVLSIHSRVLVFVLYCLHVWVNWQLIPLFPTAHLHAMPIQL